MPVPVPAPSLDAGPLTNAAADVVVQRRDRAGVEWRVSAAWADDLLGPDGLQWDAWRAEGRLEVVKSGPHRTVYRLELPRGCVYIKHYKLASWWARIQNLVRPSKAVWEWDGARGVADRGLATFQALAVGQRRRWGMTEESFLVTRAVDHAEPLDRFLSERFLSLSPSEQTRMRSELIGAVARQTARMHVAGIRHHDYHAGNIMVRFDADGRPRLAVIDLHTVRFGPPPDRAFVKWNLVVLHQMFAGRLTRADRLRFFRGYCRERELLGRPYGPAAEFAADARDMEAYGGRQAVQWWHRSDRRWARGNRHLMKLDVPGKRCRGLSSLGNELLESIRDNPDALFADPVRFWCKTTGKHRVAGVAIHMAGAETLCYWKRAELRGLWGYLSWYFRRSRVRHAWEVGHAFLRRGLPTPRPLAFVETFAGLRVRMFLLTQGIPESVTVSTFLRSYYPGLDVPAQGRWRRQFVRRLADVVRQLHSFGFDHRDLKASNILVAETPTDNRLWLLDLDAVRRWSWLPRLRIVQNLSRLCVSSMTQTAFSRTDRLRFLLRYLDTPQGRDWKPWWRSIDRRCDLKIARNHRTGRPLT